MWTNFGRFVLIFIEMALIVDYEYLSLLHEFCHDLTEKGEWLPIQPTSIRWIITFGRNAEV